MIRVQLNPKERQQLQARARQEKGRVSERIHFVLLSDQGKSPPEIGQLLGYNAITVREWLSRYQAEGLAGLDDKPRSGRPAKANEPFRNNLEQWMNIRPNRLGYLATFWTVALLVTHLASQGWQISGSTVRRTLHTLDYRWRRPRLAVTRRDPAGSARMAVISRAIGQVQPADHFFSLDESEFKMLPVLRAMWSKIAHTVRIPTPLYNASVWAFGAVDIFNGQWLSSLYDKHNSINFIDFLEKIVQACPTGHIWIVVDHAPTHTAKKVTAWLQTHPQVTLLFLPKYASHLNPIERIWGMMKDKVVANYCYPTLAALRRAVQQHLDNISSSVALQTTGLNV
jgi:transposase